MRHQSLFPEDAPVVERDAVFSPCATWRYRLHRKIGPGIRAAICMVNPSIASGEREDPTSTKLLGFGERGAIGAWDVVNLAAGVTTDVRGLRDMADPVGPDNDMHIREAFAAAQLHVVAWGVNAKLPVHLRTRWKRVLSIAGDLNVRLFCWGVNTDGHPKHPLMLAYSTPLQEWRPPT